MADIPKWLLSLSKLTPEKAAKRIAGWKPRTLAKRAQALGIETFSARTMNRIKRGTFTPSANTVAKIGRRIMREGKQVISQAAQTVDELIPVITSTFDRWIKLEDWVMERGDADPSLNVDFSLNRLRLFTWVLETGGEVYFTNRKWNGIPERNLNKSDFVVYEVRIVEEYDADAETESWYQVSESDPGISIQDAKQEMKDVQERSQAAIGHDRYQWWNNPATSLAIFNFIGIGVLTS